MVALVNGSGTKIMQNKKVWSLVNVDDFGGWRRNCNDQESHGIKKLKETMKLLKQRDYVVLNLGLYHRPKDSDWSRGLVLPVR